MAHFDIAIIGTGSGNSILDERYADKRVAICEQGVFGGTCLNVGCIPTKMFVYAAEVAQSARESARYGVDAHVDGVRWTDIVSRVFGRIDPIAMGGENYRRSSPNVQVFASHTRFGPTQTRRPLRAAHRRRRRVHRRPGRHRRRLAGRDSRCHRRMRCALPHQRHHHAHRRRARAPDHRRWRLHRVRVRPHLLRAGQPRHADDPRQHAAARPRRRHLRCASPTSRPGSGRSATTTSWPTHGRRRRRRDHAARTARRCAATCCSSPPDACPTATCSMPSMPA